MSTTTKVSHVAALSPQSATMSARRWLGIALGAAGAEAMARHPETGVHIHLVAFYLWLIPMVVNAIMLSVLPILAKSSPYIESRMPTYRLVLLGAAMVGITGCVAVSGGAVGPMWVMYLPGLCFVATTIRPWQSTLWAFSIALGVLGASYIAHTVSLATLPWLILVLPVFPALTWFNAQLATAIWSLRAERARASARSCRAGSTELSAMLAKAAEGDLSVSFGTAEGEHEALELLSDAFSHTLTNLRGLVGADPQRR